MAGTIRRTSHDGESLEPDGVLQFDCWISAAAAYPGETAFCCVKNFRNFAAQRLTLEPASALDFEYATRLIDHTERGLRAGDALHLALCQRLNATIFSADKVMLITAKKLGIAVEQI